MIIVENISKSFGTQELFRDAGFRLNAGERVGLVGRNGHGKTTLLRMILGEEQADAGTITIPKNYTLGHVIQEPRFGADTVLEEGCRGLPAGQREDHWKVEKILDGLGFSTDDMRKRPELLSGGFQVRLNLATVLVRGVNLLLLDEPNNYLDITSIRWLTRYLKSWKGELILITHDRGFMDNVATHTMGIYRKTFRKIRGDTEKLYSQLALEEEIHEKTRLNDEKERKKTEQFIRRFRAKARLAGLVQSRIKALEKRLKPERLERAADLDFSFSSRPCSARQLMHAEGLTFGYEAGNLLFADLSFSVGACDRICVIGKNGKGKTTLMKTLAGLLRPLAGEVALHPAARAGYYGQANVDSLAGDRTVLEEILAADPAVDNQKARDIAGMMLFGGDDALKRIRVLSGGEKSRVLLARVIATPVNLLLLDEPTNHLDMEACDALLEALGEFDGALVVITHNEMLLDGLAERLIVFQGQSAGLFEGGYREFLETRGWDDEKPDPVEAAQGGARAGKPDRRESRRLRAALVNERARVLKPLQGRVEDLESLIVAAESELGDLHASIDEASRSGDGPRIAALSKRIHAGEKRIETLFAQLETAHGEFEEHRAAFERRLVNLDADAGGG